MQGKNQVLAEGAKASSASGEEDTNCKNAVAGVEHIDNGTAFFVALHHVGENVSM
jgi:hypothetical protein